MKRMTYNTGGRLFYIIDDMIQQDENGYSGQAIERLAKFEDFFDDLNKNLIVISNEMAKLREDDKSHSPRFKELFTKKMINNNILMMLKYYGLE